MQFNVLGALEVLDSEGRPVEVGGTQPRAVLAMLLLATDRVARRHHHRSPLAGESTGVGDRHAAELHLPASPRPRSEVDG